MKLRSTNRIYFKEDFISAQPIILRGDIAHYIRNVLRLKVNNKIRLFNEILGEYLTKIVSCDKKEVYLEPVLEQPPRFPTKRSKLAIAPCLIKNDRFSIMLDMSVQLGVTHISPIITTNTVFKNQKLDRMERIIIEAAEQSERLDIPTISEPINLFDLDFTKYEAVIYADEHSDHNVIPERSILAKENILLIVGPEGGFTNDELEKLSTLANSYAISLGENILRAETAMIKLISYVEYARS